MGEEATTAPDFVHLGETGCLSRLMELLINPYKNAPPQLNEIVFVIIRLYKVAREEVVRQDDCLVLMEP